MTDITPDTALYALQGPASINILSSAGMPEAVNARRFHIASGNIGDCTVLAARTGYTGEDGFEIKCSREDAGCVWTALIAAGKEFGLAPCGLAARDVLRIPY